MAGFGILWRVLKHEHSRHHWVIHSRIGHHVGDAARGGPVVAASAQAMTRISVVAAVAEAAAVVVVEEAAAAVVEP